MGLSQFPDSVCNSALPAIQTLPFAQYWICHHNKLQISNLRGRCLVLSLAQELGVWSKTKEEMQEESWHSVPLTFHVSELRRHKFGTRTVSSVALLTFFVRLGRWKGKNLFCPFFESWCLKKFYPFKDDAFVKLVLRQSPQEMYTWNAMFCLPLWEKGNNSVTLGDLLSCVVQAEVCHAVAKMSSKPKQWCVSHTLTYLCHSRVLILATSLQWGTDKSFPSSHGALDAFSVRCGQMHKGVCTTMVSVC